MKTSHLILGGMRSGKSQYALTQAQKQVTQHKLRPYFVATATAIDKEMQARIEHHQLQRNAHWQLIESPIDLADAIEQKNFDDCIIIDCLTLWLNNCLYEDQWEAQRTRFFQALTTTQAHCFFISNEISMGVIPMGKENRHYVDELGRLHQQLAQQCERVTLMVAGIAARVK